MNTIKYDLKGILFGVRPVVDTRIPMIGSHRCYENRLYQWLALNTHFYGFDVQELLNLKTHLDVDIDPRIKLNFTRNIEQFSIDINTAD